jgi:hypothetical protein
MYEAAVASPDFQSQTTSLPSEARDEEFDSEALPQPAKANPATRTADHSARCFIAAPSSEVASGPAVGRRIHGNVTRMTYDVNTLTYSEEALVAALRAAEG